MPEREFDILVAGEINPDLVLRGNILPEFGQVEKLVDSADLTVGSSSAIFACGAARLGLKVAFIGVCGDDLFGKFMLDAMSARGVDIIAGDHPRRRTDGHERDPRPGQRPRHPHLPGIDPRSDHRRYPRRSLLKRARHLHVASYFLQTGLQPGLAALFEEARDHGMTTSLDPNWDPAERWEGFDTLLRKVDIFLPNENEAMSITKAKTLQQAMLLLNKKTDLAVVKCGAKGACLSKGTTEIEVPGLKVEVVDTVGAGDSFDAGFLYGHLNGWGLKKSLALAAVCGSLSTRAAGGVAAQPTLEEALGYVPFTG